MDPSTQNNNQPNYAAAPPGVNPAATPMVGSMQPGVAPPQGVPGRGPAAHSGIKTNPNSTQNTLQIAEIRDGVVIMNDGSFRSVIMVKSINFDLMSLQEQEAVEQGYQG